jgi:alpha-mannosidase
MRTLIAALLCCTAACLPAVGYCQTAAPSPQEYEMHDLSTGNTLYIVGYAHLDTQWRWSYRESIRDYLKDTLRDNFALFEKYPEYIFNFSGSRRYEMMKEYFPEDYERMKGYVASGNWFPCGSSVDECDVNVPSCESLIRQVLYGNRYFRDEFGKTSQEFILPDCFGFPANMPGVLSHCGIRGFSTQKLTWGSAVGIPFNVGVWDGLDDSSVVLAAFNPGAYVGRVDEDLSSSPEWLERIQANGDASGVYADYHYFGTGDMGGAPTTGSMEWIRRSINGSGPIKVVSSTAEQMFLDIHNSDVPNLPHYRGDLLLTQHSAGSITSQAYMKRWNHMNELLASAAEGASVTATLTSGATYPKKKLADAWGLTLGGQMHDILPGTSLPFAYELSYNDEVLAMNQFADVLTTGVEQVASTLDTNVEGIPLVVYNPLGSARGDIVRADVDFGIAAPQHVRVTDQNGDEVPSQILSRDGNRAGIAFQALVPTMSCCVFDVQAADAAALASDLSVTESTLENLRYRVTLNAAGDVASIYDKQIDQELLSEPMRLAFTHDAPGYWPAWNIDWADQSQAPYAYVDGPASISIVEHGPACVAIQVDREAQGSKFSQTIRLTAGGQRVEFSDVIDWRSQNCNLKASFPLTASNPNATYSWECGTIERGNNDEKKYEVPAHQWFDLTDSSGEFGTTILCPHKYGSDKPSDNTVRLTLLRTPGVHSDDYSDQASQDWGRHEISYGIAGHTGDWRSEQSYWQAYGLEQPLIAFQTGKHSGANGRTHALVYIDTRSVRVLACKQAEDTNEVILRMVELDGKSQPGVKFNVNHTVLSAREVNGQEYGDAAVARNGNYLTANFGPYEIKTFAISLQADPIAMSESLAVQLPFNLSVATVNGEAAIGGFESGGRSLAAEMLPSSLDDAGVTFSFAPAGNDQLNAVACEGQSIALPSGNFNRLYLIAASAPGDQDVEFSVDGVAHSLHIQDWGGYVGQWDNRVWKGNVPDIAFVWTNELDHITKGYTRRDPVAWYASHRHRPHGQDYFYDYSYLYRYAIDVPVGAQSLTLPDNSLVKILAISVASVADTEFRPAQPLYDTLAGNMDISELPELKHIPLPKKED